MKNIKNILVVILSLTLFACPTNKSDNNISIAANSESRTVDVTYSLDIEHDETIALKSKQDIITTYTMATQEITVFGEYKETIAGLTVQEGSKVRLDFKDVTDCYPDDDCLYKAILQIKVDGELVANGSFNCSNGVGSGFVEYTFQ